MSRYTMYTITLLYHSSSSTPNRAFPRKDQICIQHILQADTRKSLLGTAETTYRSSAMHKISILL